MAAACDAVGARNHDEGHYQTQVVNAGIGVENETKELCWFQSDAVRSPQPLGRQVEHKEVEQNLRSNRGQGKVKTLYAHCG